MLFFRCSLICINDVYALLIISEIGLRVSNVFSALFCWKSMDITTLMDRKSMLLL